jgi:hypothetical protein
VQPLVFSDCLAVQVKPCSVQKGIDVPSQRATPSVLLARERRLIGSSVCVMQWTGVIRDVTLI